MGAGISFSHIDNSTTKNVKVKEEGLMNAEALVGTVLGTCMLQRLIGQGGMGAVFLAQQSRPRRQVAVKVLLPMASLTPNQLAAFLERFRRETDAAASLEHPNIMPVHEYGERDNLAYLVMPYVSGGTLRDEMERECPMPLAKIVNYVDQLAAALDFAHAHGVIHRDIKPANILMTPEGRLLLTDFGLVKVIIEGQTPQVRLTGEGAPVGTPDYMSPEQVIGEDVDGRSDLYSLGVILYQMITGTTPFQGETSMQIASQHLHIPPPSPHLLRPDLPVAAEQVILRALAKRPSERYACVQDLAQAFRTALIGTGIPLGGGGSAALNSATAARLRTLQASFDTARQTGYVPTFTANASPFGNATGFLPAFGARNGSGLLSKPSGRLPSETTGSIPAAAKSDRSTGLLSRTGKFPQMAMGAAGTMGTTRTAGVANSDDMMGSTGMLPTQTLTVPSTDSIRVPNATQFDSVQQLSPELNTGALTVPRKATNTVKLTAPLKIVQVPVAGQPGRYVTGLLPSASTAQLPPLEDTKPQKMANRLVSIFSLLGVLLLLIGTASTFWFVRTHSSPTAKPKTTTNQPVTMGTPNVKATALFQATVTARANVILDDPLSTNTNNWLTTPANVYAFKNDAYHITDQGDNGRATVLQSAPFAGAIGYTLTMDEIKGDDASPNNSFGMIMRFNQQTKGKTTITTFYSFEVVNSKGGEYQFWKYDDTKGASAASAPWTKLWHQPFGGEFHQGNGIQNTNTVKVFMDGAKFTITVNGKVMTTVQDTAFASGTVGMIVNLNGTEVAFKNLLLTRN
ncbi:MAG: hypothetical protein PVS3B3_16050 [Ktedonobacteraceae bacterium]